MNKLQSVGFLFFMVGLVAVFNVDIGQTGAVIVMLGGALAFLLGAE